MDSPHAQGGEKRSAKDQGSAVRAEVREQSRGGDSSSEMDLDFSGGV